MTKATTKRAGSDQETFTAAEREAMKERAKEYRQTRRGKDLEPEVLAKIAEMTGTDREIAERLHDIVRATAPDLAPRTWYGMPAYARDGKVLVFFQPAEKFDSRYATVGFNDVARLDDGPMWPTTFAVTGLTPDVEERLTELVRRAVTD